MGGKGASLFILCYNVLPLATINLVGDNRELKFDAYFELLYPFCQFFFTVHFRGFQRLEGASSFIPPG